MRKSLNTTLALLGVCFALMAWYFGYERNYKLDKNGAEDKAKILVVLEKDQIQELEVDRLMNAPAEGTVPAADFKPDYRTVKMRKSGTDWNLYEPLQDAADSSTIAGMLGTLTTTRQDRVIDERPKDLNEFGLKFPLVKIRVRKDASSAAQEVWLGSNTPVGFNCYAKTAGSDTVYRIARSLRSGFEKTLKDVRNKTILAIPRLEVAEVEISADKGRNSLVMKKDPKKDEWTIARESIPADTAEWNKTMTALLDTKATDFPDITKTKLSAYGLDPAHRVVTIEKTDKTKSVLLLGRVKVKGKDGKDSEKVYVKRADKETVFEVEKDLLAKVERAPEVYRSLQLAKFNRYDVNKVKLERTEPVEVLKQDGKWAFADGKDPVDPAKIDALLTKLQDVKIAKYLSEHTPKLTAANTTLTIRLYEKKAAATPADPKAPADANAKKDDGEVEVAVLKFGKSQNKLVTVERNDIPIPFTINDSELNYLNPKKADLVQKPEQKTEAKKEEPKKG